uniref:Maturase n=1 Tax=Lepocinclis spirogyroides TaxID=298306 RepID=Q0R3L1_9EUGL|nr:maturase [Lepocinclis spirogyroides]
MNLTNTKHKVLKRVILPGLDLLSLKSLNNLLTPSSVLIPLFFSSVLAQISDDLKSVLEFKEIQNLISVKLYSKVLLTSLTVFSLTLFQSIAKTLGYELESLSVLNVSERLDFLDNIHKKLLNGNYKPKLYSNTSFLQDPVLLSSHRIALSLQSRSLMTSVPIFSPHSLVVGLSVKEISLFFLLVSAKFFWKTLDLDEDEFDYLLRKDTFLLLFKLNLNNIFLKLSTNEDYLKILIYLEIFSLVQFPLKLSFFEDQVLLKSSNNLTLLERELGFLHRPIPNGSVDFLVAENEYNIDNLLRVAIDQRKLSKLRVKRMLTRLGKGF